MADDDAASFSTHSDPAAPAAPLQPITVRLDTSGVKLGMNVKAGGGVKSVSAGGAAGQAGVTTGHRITAIGGEPVGSDMREKEITRKLLTVRPLEVTFSPVATARVAPLLPGLTRNRDPQSSEAPAPEPEPSAADPEPGAPAASGSSLRKTTTWRRNRTADGRVAVATSLEEENDEEDGEEEGEEDAAAAAAVETAPLKTARRLPAQLKPEARRVRTRAQVHEMIPAQLEADGLPSDVSEEWIDGLYFQHDVDRNGEISDDEVRFCALFILLCTILHCFGLSFCFKNDGFDSGSCSSRSCALTFSRHTSPTIRR